MKQETKLLPGEGSKGFGLVSDDTAEANANILHEIEGPNGDGTPNKFTPSSNGDISPLLKF